MSNILRAASVLLALSPFGAAPAAADWKLLFDDEFNATTLDPTKWTNGYLLPKSWGVVSFPGLPMCWWPADSFLGGGLLHMVARRQTVLCGKPGTKFTTFNYTAGAVTTYAHFSHLYGYTEIRALLPKGQGMWLAYWMVTASNAWPPEIDIFEVINNESTFAHETLHYKDAKGYHQMDGSTVPMTDATRNWHTYGLDWAPDHLTWYIDGKPTKTVTHNVPQVPMYPQMTFQLGSATNWPGAVNATTPFPMEWKIDYLRVYQRLPNTPLTAIPFGKP